jgi:hypothetical protein
LYIKGLTGVVPIMHIFPPNHMNCSLLTWLEPVDPRGRENKFKSEPAHELNV